MLIADFCDRYILKLFRDYVFHSMGVDGKPVLDLSHVLTSLNKVGDINQRSATPRRRRRRV
jgi:hypothetical protein